MEWQEWEIENQHNISGWKAEWDIKEGYKVLTFILKDKTEKVFEIKL
jgi:hypothetical protein